MAMERRDLLSPSDLHLLEKLLGQVCPVLLKDIQQFKACYETTHAKGNTNVIIIIYAHEWINYSFLQHTK